MSSSANLKAACLGPYIVGLHTAASTVAFMLYVLLKYAGRLRPRGRKRTPCSPERARRPRNSATLTSFTVLPWRRCGCIQSRRR